MNSFSTIGWGALYAGIFIGVGLLCILPIQKPEWKNWRWYVCLLWGALSFHITLMVQPPIQTAYMNAVSPAFVSCQSLALKSLLTFPYTLISGLVQELLKMLPLIPIFFLGVKDKRLRGLAVASGLGFGLWEAWRLTGITLAQFGGWNTVMVLERVTAIVFHGCATALIAYGMGKGKTIRFYLLASLLHGVINFSVPLYSLGIVSLLQAELIGVIGATITFYLTIRKWKESRPGITHIAKSEEV